jgi:hypothetical protein
MRKAQAENEPGLVDGNLNCFVPNRISQFPLHNTNGRIHKSTLITFVQS